MLKNDTACETCRRHFKGIHKATDTCALRISWQKKMSSKHPWILFILVCLGTLKLFWMSDVAAFLLHHHCSIIFIRLEKEMVARCDNVKNKTFFCRTFSFLASIMYGIQQESMSQMSLWLGCKRRQGEVCDPELMTTKRRRCSRLWDVYLYVFDVSSVAVTRLVCVRGKGGKGSRRDSVAEKSVV